MSINKKKNRGSITNRVGKIDSITNRVGKIEKFGRITESRNAVQGCNKFNSPASKNK